MLVVAIICCIIGFYGGYTAAAGEGLTKIEDLKPGVAYRVVAAASVTEEQTGGYQLLLKDSDGSVRYYDLRSPAYPMPAGIESGDCIAFMTMPVSVKYVQILRQPC